MCVNCDANLNQPCIAWNNGTGWKQKLDLWALHHEVVSFSMLSCSSCSNLLIIPLRRSNSVNSEWRALLYSHSTKARVLSSPHRLFRKVPITWLALTSEVLAPPLPISCTLDIGNKRITFFYLSSGEFKRKNKQKHIPCSVFCDKKMWFFLPFPAHHVTLLGVLILRSAEFVFVSVTAIHFLNALANVLFFL